MTCAAALAQLRRYTADECPPEVIAHIAGCAACRAQWRRIDPVAATAAYGEVRAPEAMAGNVRAAIATLPPPTRRPAVSAEMPVLATAALLAAWWLGGRVGPPILQQLLGWVATIAGGAGAWAGLTLTLVGSAGPLAVVGAMAVVVGEMAAFRHLKRLHVR